MNSTIRRLALGAGLSIAGVAFGVLALSTAAHADDGSQRPGGALGAVEDAVDEVLPKPTKPAEAKPEPAKTPEHAEPKPPEHAESEHSTEPTRAPEPEDEPADEPVTDDRPRDPEPTPTTPPVVIDVPPIVVDLPPVVVDVPPVEVITTPPPPVVLPTPPPVVAPTPTPTAPTPAPEQPSSPLPVVVGLPTAPPAAPALPALPDLPALELPVVIGPVAAPAQQVDDGIYPPGVLPDPAPAVATCDDPIQQDDTGAGHSRGDGKTQRRPSGHPGNVTTAPPAKPCPGTPVRPDGQAAAVGAVKPPPPTGEQLVTDSVAGAYSSPVLQRLHQLRGRSHTLAGRTEHPEPGPA